MADPEISRFPYKELACMPGSSTTPGCPSACVGALGHIAFRYTDSVGTRNQFSIAAQWLACTFPCRRFADTLAEACARLGADVVRYSFIAVDLHHLLLAGLPAHLCKNPNHLPCRVDSARFESIKSREIAPTCLKMHCTISASRVFTQVRRETGKE